MDQNVQALSLLSPDQGEVFTARHPQTDLDTRQHSKRTSMDFYLFLENENSHALDMYGNTQACVNAVGCERAD